MEARTWEIPHIQLSQAKTIVFIDFETTGFTPQTAARIIEYSAIKVSPTETTIFHEMAKPYIHSIKSPTKIPLKIQELTHITNDMVAESDNTFDVFKRFHAFIDGHVCIAHNAKFEQLFIYYYCMKLKLPFNMVFRDTLPMFKSHYNIGALSKITQSDKAHMAFDDCWQMIRLMKECQEAGGSKLLELCSVVEMPESSKKAVLEDIRKVKAGA